MQSVPEKGKKGCGGFAAERPAGDVDRLIAAPRLSAAVAPQQHGSRKQMRAVSR